MLDLRRERHLLLILVLVYLLARLPLALSRPLMLDEALYAINIQEMIGHPSAVPTFFGMQTGWKPPLFFWVYAPPVFLLENLGLPLELAFRLPTLAFGLANVFLLYSLVKKLYGNAETAFYTALIFSGFYLTAYVDASLYIDTFNLTLILASLCCYANAEWGERRFLLAGAFAFLAFFTKLWVAAMIPVLALCWAFFHARDAFRSRLFLLSLIAVPLAFIAYALYVNAFSSPSLFQDLTPAYTVGGRMSADSIPLLLLRVMQDSLGILIATLSLWAGFAIIGAFGQGRRFPMMLAWALLLAIPAFAAFQLPWYFLPVLPPLAFFSALLLRSEKGDGPDALGLAFCLFALAAAFVLAWHAIPVHDVYPALRGAGIMLEGKDNVLVCGAAQGLVAYKAAAETLRYGTPLDFGWVIPGSWNGSVLEAYLRDYRTAEFNATDNIVLAMPPNPHPPVYRKGTQITHFDYVAMVGFDVVPDNSTLIYNRSGVQVYRVQWR